MARRLVNAGYAVTVWARRRETVEPLVSAGSLDAESPADVAARSDIIMTMVTDTKAVEEVALGERGIVRGIRAGSVVVDHSTIAPDGARRIATALRRKASPCSMRRSPAAAPLPKRVRWQS